MKRRLLAHILRYRRELSAGCAGLAVLLTLNLIRPVPHDVSTVVIARHTVAAGTRITEQDVATTQVPTSHIWPEVLTDTAPAIGQLTSHALVTHQFIGRNDLVNSVSLAGLGSNFVAVQIPWSGGIEFIQPGIHIDVYAHRSDSALLVAADARVLSAPTQSSSGIFSVPNSGNDFLLLAVTTEQAQDVASQPQDVTFTVTVRGE